MVGRRSQKKKTLERCLAEILFIFAVEGKMLLTLFAMRFLVGFIVLLVMGIAGLTAVKYPRFRRLVTTFAPSERIAMISVRSAALVLILLSLGCLLVALLVFAGVLA